MGFDKLCTAVKLWLRLFSIKYDDVRVIQTGKVGLVIEVKDGRYLVDFGDAKEWFDECDLLPVEQEDCED